MAFKNPSGRRKKDDALKEAPGSATSPLLCGVCRRPKCQLQSHKAYIASRKRPPAKQQIKTPTSESSDDRLVLLNPSYTKSYAYTPVTPVSSPGVPYSVSAGRLDGFHDLPIPNGDRSELHQAVYNCEFDDQPAMSDLSK